VAASNSGTTSIAGTLVGGGLIDIAAGESVRFTVVGVTKANATLGSFNNTATTTLPTGFIQGTGAATATASVTVAARAPTLSAVSPASADRGKTTGVTLTGQYLTGATAVAITPISGSAINCTAVTVVSDTSVTASCNIPVGTVAGAGTIGVTTPGGSTTTAFTVTTPSFSITSLSQTSAIRGNGTGGTNNVNLTITGAGLATSTAVTLTPATGAAITCSNVTAVSDTSVTATCGIAYNAARGAGGITVTTSLGTTNSLAFTISAGTPTITSVSPSSVVKGGGAGAVYRETVTGTYLYEASAMTMSTPGLVNANGTCGAVTVVSDTQVYASCTQGVAYGGGTRTLSVTTPAGTTGTVNLVVATTATAPASVTIPRGPSTVDVTITAGGGLTGATGVQLFSTGILGANQASVTCTIQPGATDTSLTARCSSSAAVASATRLFRVTLGGNNSGNINTANVTVVQQ
jgi:aerobic-type carbon monoxide dehydrogenase small subunit (CoxS/CutS family)